MSDIMKILTELKDFKAVEVSYVTRGANKIPFLITKEDDVGKKELAKLIEGSKLENLDEIKKTLEGSKIDSSKVDAITGGLRIFSVMKEEIGEEALTSVLNLSKIVKEDSSDDDDEKKKAFEEMTAKIAKLEEDNADLNSQIAKAKTDGETGKGESVDIMKSLPILKDGSLDESKIPEELRGAVTHLFKSNKDSADLIAKVEKDLADERDVRITKAYQEKAATFNNIKVEGLATVLKDVAASSPESFKVLESILKVANDGLSTKEGGSFDEIGSSRSSTQSSDGVTAESVYAQIEKEADVAITGEMSLIEKMDLFMTGNERGQALYTQYQDKIRRG